MTQPGQRAGHLIPNSDVRLKHDIHAVMRQFCVPGVLMQAAPYGTGHINDTYCVVYDQGGTSVRYILQRINHAVFRDPAALMENVARVTAHLAGKSVGDSCRSRRVLTLIPAHDGNPYHREEHGNHWRVYVFIERARTFDAIESASQAFQAANAFGQFQRRLIDLPAPRLNDTIPDFHHTPRRFASLENAIADDPLNRAALARPEIDFALNRKGMISRLREANLPERVTHNDTKLNNVMLDDDTGEGICVIDLDTVMPGLAPYDFGDMVRTATSPATEDERDLSKVRMQFPMFEALVRGYLASATDFLTPAEKKLLPLSGMLITFEAGIRFLADFLSGDIYFKVHREGHNLDRCRTQFKLVESIEQQQNQMHKLLDTI